MLPIVTILALLVPIVIDRAQVLRAQRCPSHFGLCPKGNGKLVYVFHQRVNLTRFYFSRIYLAAVCKECITDIEVRPIANGPGDRWCGKLASISLWNLERSRQVP